MIDWQPTFWLSRRQPFRNHCEEELGGISFCGIDRDGKGNLEDLLRQVFIDAECGNLELVSDGGELNRSISRRKKSDVLQAYVCPLCDKYYMSEIVSSKSMWNIANHLSKHDFSCG